MLGFFSETSVTTRLAATGAGMGAGRGDIVLHTDASEEDDKVEPEEEQEEQEEDEEDAGVEGVAPTAVVIGGEVNSDKALGIRQDFTLTKGASAEVSSTDVPTPRVKD